MALRDQVLIFALSILFPAPETEHFIYLPYFYFCASTNPAFARSFAGPLKALLLRELAVQNTERKLVKDHYLRNSIRIVLHNQITAEPQTNLTSISSPRTST